MIDAKNLTKRYGAFTAVDNISFTAQTGEVVGLLGPNGAGKTTTMRMLTGFTPPTRGTAKIAGFDVTVDSLDAREHVGYLPERVPIYPDMTVLEYVQFWAAMRGMRGKARRQATDAAIERVGLMFKRNALVRNLSKGMRQRLGLAQALVHNPDVIILDEPTIGIDPRQVIEVRDTVRELGRDHAVLFSTHILTEAEQVCDRVLILNQGRIVAAGTPNELRNQLQGGAGLFVRISDQADLVVGSLPGLVDATPQGNGYVLHFSQDVEDPRTLVFDAVVSAGLKLLEMRTVDMTLEDIFLKLVGEAP